MDCSLVREKLPQRMSLYFDFLRVLAALVVMVSHYPLTAGLAKVLTATNYAYDAVVVFFVLSGYVISYAAEVLECGFKKYAINRLARILPVAVTSITFALVTFYLFADKRPDIYGDPSQLSHWLRTMIESLTFTNQAWHNNELPFSNGPYWSLAFEVWCYVFYAVIMYCRGWGRVLLFLLLSVMLGPKQMIILPMWLAGSIAFHLRHKFSLSRGLLILVLVMPIVVYWLIQAPLPRDWSYAYIGSKVEAFIGMGLDGAANFGWGYVLAILVALHLYAFGQLAKDKKVSADNILVRWIRGLSGYTFTLYLFHGPLIKMCLTVLNISKADFSIYYRLGIYAVTFALVYLVGNIVEHKKYVFRMWVGHLIDFLAHVFKRAVKA